MWLLKKILLYFGILIGLILLIGIINGLYKNLDQCKPVKMMVMGKNIEFPIAIKDAIKKYNLNYSYFTANSKLEKDTVMVLTTSWRYGHSIGEPKDSLDYMVYAYLFYVKNPTTAYFNKLKVSLEQQYGKKFIKKKFKFNEHQPGYFLQMRLNDCLVITLKPNDHILNLHYKIQKENEEACVLGVYYDVHEDDINSGNNYNGALEDIQGIRF